MPGPSNLDELLAMLRAQGVAAVAPAIARQVAPGQVRTDDGIAGLVWATVDVQRTIEAIAAPFVPTERDRIMGGSAHRVRCGRLELIIEEPVTEGRLAANLARYGEGIAAILVEPARGGAGWHADRSRQGTSTPLGRPGWLRPHEFPWGPFVIEL